MRSLALTLSLLVLVACTSSKLADDVVPGTYQVIFENDVYGPREIIPANLVTVLERAIIATVERPVFWSTGVGPIAVDAPVIRVGLGCFPQLSTAEHHSPISSFGRPDCRVGIRYSIIEGEHVVLRRTVVSPHGGQDLGFKGLTVELSRALRSDLLRLHRTSVNDA